MNIAILARLGAQSLQHNLTRWWTHKPGAVAQHPLTPNAQTLPGLRPQRAAAATAVPAHQTRNDSQRPLRIVRVVESGQRTNSVGRMVISGRMADVCAELERLAAREAALT